MLTARCTDTQRAACDADSGDCGRFGRRTTTAFAWNAHASRPARSNALCAACRGGWPGTPGSQVLGLRRAPEVPCARLSLRVQMKSADDGCRAQVLVGGVPADLDDKSLLQAFERSDDDSQVTVCIQVDGTVTNRLDTFLSQRITILSRSFLNRIIKAQCVTLNGKAPKPSAKLKSGDSLVINLPPPIAPSVLAEDIPVDILLEDAQIVVLNKQANLVVHPAPTVPNGTLVNALAFHFQKRGAGQLSAVGSEKARPGIVHRLDKNTTGAMVVAKTEGAHLSLYEQFAVRSTDKRYFALVHGTWKNGAWSGLIDEPLARHPYDPMRFAVCAKGEGKASQTRFFVRETFDGYTLLELQLLTGRTHQIRVHLSHIGHPIVGDDLYGGRPLVLGDVMRTQDVATQKRGAKSSKVLLLNRQALHSSVLTITHPVSEERISVHAPAPQDMAKAVGLLRQFRLDQIVTQKKSGAAVDMSRILPVLDAQVSLRCHGERARERERERERKTRERESKACEQTCACQRRHACMRPCAYDTGARIQTLTQMRFECRTPLPNPSPSCTLPLSPLHAPSGREPTGASS